MEGVTRRQARPYVVWMMRILALLAMALPLSAADPVWIEYGPDGPIARTIVTGACPSILIDGASRQMATRAAASGSYPVTSCETALPAGVRSASIGGAALPVQKLGRTAKVAILGDTGCRLKKGDPPQKCSDPKAWPFATVAASIAAWDPDLILHVGDYYYREATCDGDDCKKAPYDWNRWNADFFTPAAPLLPNAPWVLVRGNHEECKRAAEGWFRFLDPRRYAWEGVAACRSNADFTPPYVAAVGNLNVIVFDTSALAEDDDGQASMVAGWLKQYAKPGGWLLLHHPFWGSRKDRLDTPTLWKAWAEAGDAADPIALVLTGHIHLLELLSFGDGGPPQAIVGNGGTAMAKKAQDATGMQFGTNGRTASAFTQDDHFGFIAATPSGSGWTFDVRTSTGKSRTKCSVTATAIVCD